MSAIAASLSQSRLWKLPWTRAFEPVAFCAVGLFVAMRHGPLAGIAAGAAAIALTELAARKPEWAVGALAFSFAAMPRIDAQLRAEDFVTLGLVLAALRNKRPFDTPLDGPIAGWLLVIGLSLGAGLVAGTIAKPAVAAFTALKLVEYAIAFYAAWLWRAKLLGPFAAGLAVLAAWGATELLLAGGRPFDRVPYLAESNHVGGFAVLVASLAFQKKAWPVLGLAVGVAALSQSRIALVALGALAIYHVAVPGARRAALLVLLAGAAAAIGPLRARVEGAPREWRTFVESERRVEEGYPPAFSYTRNRFEMWSLLSEDFARFPVLGTGPGSRDRVIYENAYVMIACEFGGVGLLVFLFLASRAFRAAPGATIVMLVLGLTSISFLLAREAGPWWMLVGAARSDILRE